jgi:Leucine-rich repeat (LRR) protein
VAVGSASRPWRRFLRFSVRGLIVLVLVIGVGLGWIVRSAHMQREAVAAIRNSGGIVFYDWEWSNGTNIPGGKLWARAWLEDRFGVDYFSHVTFVRITPGEGDDAAILQVGRLTGLEILNHDHSGDCIVYSSTLSDPGLAHLKGLTSLSQLTLNLSDTHVTDAGLVFLKGLTNLSQLDLSGAPITGTGLAHLKGLTKLNRVGLRRTHVTDAGLMHLKGLMPLSDVDLMGTRVTDGGLMNLKGLTNLSSLILDGTQVSDTGLAHLKGLTNLGSLSLSGTQVSDAGLPHLTGLVQLSVLWLHDTHVTDAGIRKLKQALPSLTVYH